MQRLLKLLLLTTALLPLATGTMAILAGFGDPWGMGGKDPCGIFITAALPILPPGLYQIMAWPLTYGFALLMSPLALLKRRGLYPAAMLLFLAGIAGSWLLGWTLAPDYVNISLDGKSYVPGRLNSNLWKFGMYLLTDAAVLCATVCWWFWREKGTLAEEFP